MCICSLNGVNKLINIGFVMKVDNLVINFRYFVLENIILKEIIMRDIKKICKRE